MTVLPGSVTRGSAEERLCDKRNSAFKKLMDDLWIRQRMKSTFHMGTADDIQRIYQQVMKYTQGPSDKLVWESFQDLMCKINTALQEAQIPMTILHDNFTEGDHWFMSEPKPANTQKDMAEAHLWHYMQGWNTAEREKDLSAIPTEKEIFTYLYNLAYSPFYPDDPRAEYDITEINMLCHHRNIPFQLRSIERLFNAGDDSYHFTPYTKTVVRIERCNW